MKLKWWIKNRLLQSETNTEHGMTWPKSMLSLWVTQNCYCGTNSQFCFSNCFFMSFSNGLCPMKSCPPSPHLWPPVLLDNFLLWLLASSGAGCERHFSPCSSWLLPATSCSGLMLGCMKGKFEQDRVSVASLTMCLVQGEPQLVPEKRQQWHIWSSCSHLPAVSQWLLLVRATWQLY